MNKSLVLFIGPLAILAVMGLVAWLSNYQYNYQLKHQNVPSTGADLIAIIFCAIIALAVVLVLDRGGVLR